MGNVPTKESRSRSSSFGATSNTQPSRNRRHTTLTLLGTNFGNSTTGNSSLFGHGSKGSSGKEDKIKAKEKHCLDLVVRHSEGVDGGFLAPHGIYKLNLDYDTETVRGLILARRMAPFYTPLQDFDESWTDDELVTIVRQLPLHTIESAYSDEEEDDADDHKIHRSANHVRRQEQKKRLQELSERMKELQKQCENDYLEAKAAKSDAVASRDLVLRLYRDATECPICFLYFPPFFNVSRCCGQPICSECFVQIRRLDPHPPHDDPTSENKDELPHTLISEHANCPYCAMSNFGVTYEPPLDIHVGAGGTAPSEYVQRGSFDVIPEDEVLSSLPDETKPKSPLPMRKPRRRSSIAADSPDVITTDYIRPDWELRLASVKSRLARKAATASAIHASNLLLNDNGNSSRRNGPTQFLQSLEDRMIEEAMRLSLLEEDERKKAASPQ